MELPPQPDIPRSFLYSADACKMQKNIVYLRSGAAGPPARRAPLEKRCIPARIFFALFPFCVHQIKSSDPSPTATACFERVLASVARSSLYMGIAASLGIALVIEKELSSKVKDQQVERLGHGPSLDEDVT